MRAVIPDSSRQRASVGKTKLIISSASTTKQRSSQHPLLNRSHHTNLPSRRFLHHCCHLAHTSDSRNRSAMCIYVRQSAIQKRWEEPGRPADFESGRACPETLSYTPCLSDSQLNFNSCQLLCLCLLQSRKSGSRFTASKDTSLSALTCSCRAA